MTDPAAVMLDAAALDGDFSLTEIEQATAGVTVARPLAQRDDSDPAALHAFETSGAWTVPVFAALSGLGSDRAAEWLETAEHWIRQFDRTGDPRWLNIACKIIGAVWLRRREAVTIDDGRLRLVAGMLRASSDRLAAGLAARTVPAVPGHAEVKLAESRHAAGGRPRARIMVVAGAGSSGARQLLAAAQESGLPLEALCWYGEEVASAHTGSSYARAWYPPSRPELPPPAIHPGVRQLHAATWSQLHADVEQIAPDLVVLVGMPVVPMSVFDNVRLGGINAHNGALPHYRGMDAVGWALLRGDEIECTIHEVQAKVDAGRIYGRVHVPAGPTSTLRARVKRAQLDGLLAVAWEATASGELPPGREQEHSAFRQYYRMHPHLKRLLDASPYGRAAADKRGS